MNLRGQTWWRRILLSALCCATIQHRAVASAEEEAVSARSSPDYLRSKEPDGSYSTETYCFAKGGVVGGEVRDKSIDDLKFIDVAKIIATSLRRQNYVTAYDPKKTKLLIIVYWGTTATPVRDGDSIIARNMQDASTALQIAKQLDGPIAAAAANDTLTTAMAALQLQNSMRQKADARNARLLGYDSWWEATEHLKGTPGEIRWQDMISEIEDHRYFVVLMAYDFQLLWKEKKPKLLWETRFSISANRNAFDEELPKMASYASKYFGSSSNGLVHRELPEGHVEFGEIKSLGAVPGK